MRLTILGKAVLFLIFLTMWNAVNGGLNVLYMLYAGLAAIVLISLIGSVLAARQLTLEIELPEQIFTGEETPLAITVRNGGWIPLHGLALITATGRIAIGSLAPNEARTIHLPYAFPLRGLTALTDLACDIQFPFGLFVRRKACPQHGILVLPHMERIADASRERAVTQEEIARPRRGAGDDFWSVREYAPGDDVRLISWKLSAKVGRPLIREFAEMVGDRVIVRANGVPFGEETEHRIARAASIARFFIDEGAEVRLVTDEGDTGFGRGLTQLALILKHLALLGEGRRERPTGEAARVRWRLPEWKDVPTFTTLITILSGVVAASLWLLEGLDLPTKLAVAAAVPLGLIVNRRGKSLLPQSVWSVLGVLAILAVLAIDIPAQGLLPGLTHLLAFALINRLLIPKTPRDAGRMLIILYLLFLLISWQTVRPAYLVAYTTFLILGTMTLAALAGWTSRLRARPIVAAAMTIVLILAIAGTVFAITPRISNPRFVAMMRRLGLAGMVTPELSIVSLADRMRLGAFDDVRASTRRVMQVRIAGLDDAKDRALYVRAGAFDHFDGEDWMRTSPDFAYRFHGRTITSTNGRGLYAREEGGRSFVTQGWNPNHGGIVQDFYIYPMGTSLIFAIGDPTNIQGGVVQPMFDASGTVFNATPFNRGGRYQVISQSIPVRLYEAIEDYGMLSHETYLQLPAKTDALATLAARLTRGRGTAVEKATVLETYFHEEFTYSYLGAHGRQSLDAFLFESKAANCEYFATAMALMLRTQNVPARLVIGYLTTDWKSVEGYYDVRNSDGHAWVEALIPGRGWVPFDPTPEQVSSLPTDFPLGRSAYRYLLGMQMAWYRYVIGYDLSLQRNALASLLSRWRDIAIFAALALAAIIGAIILTLTLRHHFRRKKQTIFLHPAALIYLKAQRQLARYGFMRAPGQTPAQFAATIAETNPNLSVVEEFTQAYYRARYANDTAQPLAQLLHDLGVTLKRYAERSYEWRRRKPSS